MKNYAWWLFASCVMTAMFLLMACASLSSGHIAPHAVVRRTETPIADQEVVIARQTIEGALTNRSRVTATLVAPPPDLNATATREAQQLATAVVNILIAQGTSTPDLAATQTQMAQTMATAVAATLTAPPTPADITLPVPGAIDKNPVDDATLIYVPAGEFTMGMTAEQINYLVGLCPECKNDDFIPSQPVHRVNVSSFWIYRTEITNRMYAQCVTVGRCKPPHQTNSNTRSDYWTNAVYADHPVIYIDWFSADQYCRWADGRLPTEAEWEKAARGTDGRLFPWGNAPPDSGLANIKGSVGDTVSVGSYPQGESIYGVQDMAGNVWEWVADWYEPDYYASSGYENPLGPVSSRNRQRSGRGGSWYWAGAYASAAYHDWWEPEKSGSGVGFRCVLDSNRIDS